VGDKGIKDATFSFLILLIMPKLNDEHVNLSSFC